MASKAIDFAPSKYAAKRSPELIAEMLLRISEGQTVAAMWSGDPTKFPHPSAWSNWCGDDAALSLAAARARQQGADFHAAVAETIINTEPEVVSTKEGARRDSAHVTWLKNRTDFHMKRAAQLDQGQYGDKQLLAGHDGGAIKTETLAALPNLVERMRNARKAGGPASEVTIEQPAAVTHVDPSPVGQDGPHSPEPGDPGMEFV